MSYRILTTTTTTTRTQVRVGRASLLKALRAVDIVPDYIPDHKVSLLFEVPGGADWSGTGIDISTADPLYVQWDTETTETDES